jgi:hypothetical protein
MLWPATACGVPVCVERRTATGKRRVGGRKQSLCNCVGGELALAWLWWSWGTLVRADSVVGGPSPKRVLLLNRSPSGL